MKDYYAFSLSSSSSVIALRSSRNSGSLGLLYMSYCTVFTSFSKNCTRNCTRISGFTLIMGFIWHFGAGSNPVSRILRGLRSYLNSGVLLFFLHFLNVFICNSLCRIAHKIAHAILNFAHEFTHSLVEHMIFIVWICLIK